MQGYTFFFPIAYSATDVAIYQQDVVIHRSEGTSYEETVGDLKVWHVYVGDRCKSDYGDVRFTDASGNALAYYLWPDYDAESARFTVRLEGADQGGVLMIWYGNPTATTSDGDATFLLYVDFDDEVNPFTQGDAGATFAGGFVSNATTLDPAGKSLRLAGDSAAKARYMPQVFGRGIQVDYYQYVPSTNPTSSVGGLYLAVQTPMNGYQCVLDERITHFDVQIRKNFGFVSFIGTGDLKNDAVLKSKWHKVRVTWATDGTITFSRCDAITGEVFDTASGVDTTYSSGYLGFCTYDVTYIDHVTVRTYSAAPPAATAFGPEQVTGTLPAAPSYLVPGARRFGLSRFSIPGTRQSRVIEVAGESAIVDATRSFAAAPRTVAVEIPLEVWLDAQTYLGAAPSYLVPGARRFGLSRFTSLGTLQSRAAGVEGAGAALDAERGILVAADRMAAIAGLGGYLAWRSYAVPDVSGGVNITFEEI